MQVGLAAHAGNGFRGGLRDDPFGHDRCQRLADDLDGQQSGERLGGRVELDDEPIGVGGDQAVAHGRGEGLEAAAQLGLGPCGVGQLGSLGGQRADHLVERAAEQADLVGAVDARTRSEVTRADLTGRLGQLADRPDEPSRDDGARDDGQQATGEGDDEQSLGLRPLDGRDHRGGRCGDDPSERGPGLWIDDRGAGREERQPLLAEVGPVAGAQAVQHRIAGRADRLSGERRAVVDNPDDADIQRRRLLLGPHHVDEPPGDQHAPGWVLGQQPVGSERHRAEGHDPAAGRQHAAGLLDVAGACPHGADEGVAGQ